MWKPSWCNVGKSTLPEAVIFIIGLDDDALVSTGLAAGAGHGDGHALGGMLSFAIKSV
jgi:hypothetical protein